METWEFVSSLLNYLDLDSILNLSLVNKKYNQMLSTKENLANLILYYSNNETKTKFLNFKRYTPLISYLYFIFEYKIRFIQGMEKWLPMEEVARLAGEIGNFKQIEYYKSKCKSDVAVGLCKAGRFNLLKEFNLNIENDPSNIYSILSGLAAGNHYIQIKEWLSRFKIDQYCPDEPIFEACGNKSPESLKLLFPHYIQRGLNLCKLITSCKDNESIEYLLPYCSIDEILNRNLTSDFIECIMKRYPIETTMYLLERGEVKVEAEYLAPLLDRAILKDNAIVLDKLVKQGLNLDNINCNRLFAKNFKTRSIKQNIILYLAQQNHFPILGFLDTIFSFTNLNFCFSLINYFLQNFNISTLLHQFPQSRVLKMINKKLNPS